MTVRHVLQRLRPLRRINFFFFRFANGKGEPIAFDRTLRLHLIAGQIMAKGIPE